MSLEELKAEIQIDIDSHGVKLESEIFENDWDIIRRELALLNSFMDRINHYIALEG